MTLAALCIRCRRRLYLDDHAELTCPVCASPLLEVSAPPVAVAEEMSRTVAIVDDDDDIRHALRLMFELEGFEVVGEAASGVEAVTVVKQHSPSFVILDYAMPRMNGEKTAHILRAIAPDARIVAFSAYLDSKPDWADTFLNKDRIADVAGLLETLLTVELGVRPQEV
jgi:CheY-like chemotaxis protein